MEERVTGVSARKAPIPPDIVLGSRVTVKDGAYFDSRLHLRRHAMRGDVGVVVEPRPGAAWMGWIRVKFERCPQAHRLGLGEVALSHSSKP